MFERMEFHASIAISLNYVGPKVEDNKTNLFFRTCRGDLIRS